MEIDYFPPEGCDCSPGLKSQSEFQDGLRRVQNLAAYVALGGPERPRKGLAYEPDFSWAVGACQGLTA